VTDSLEAAVDALIAAITTPARRWNPYNKTMAKREFKNRLDAAERGDLIPVAHVKALGRGSKAHLFEIRWQGIQVHEVDEHGVTFYPSVEARLLHAEPPAEPTLLVGVHAHEKVWFEGDDEQTKDVQNAEIDLGVAEFFRQGPADWGI
jgi:hypothetical protein